MRVGEARRFLHLVLVVALALVAASPSRCDSASMSSFSYQGRLDEVGLPATGTYRLTFKLFDAEADGNQVGPTVSHDSVPVLSGLFAVQLDFGVNAFGAGPRWLQMSANDEVLAPRRPIVPVPVAQFSLGPWATGGQDISYTDGKVGIGTPLPTAALEIANGDLKLSGPGAGVVFPDGSRLVSVDLLKPDRYILTGSPAPPQDYVFTGRTISTDSIFAERAGPAFYLARVEGVAAVGDDVYVVGSVASGKYSPTADTWTELSPRPTARSSFAVAAAAGRLFAVGGNSGSTMLGLVEEYNPGTGSWRSRASMAVARRSLATVAVDGRIYAIGGDTGSTVSGVVERYDPAANVWTTLAPLPTPRTEAAAAASGALIYCIGGETTVGMSASRIVEVYDPKTNAWSSGPSFPTGLSEATTFSLNGNLFVIGGDATYELVPSSGKWRICDPLVRGTFGGAEAVAGLVYLVDSFGGIVEYLPPMRLYVQSRNQ